MEQQSSSWGQATHPCSGRPMPLQSVKDMPIVQDAPPPGGFPSIRIERRLPSTGPTGVAIFAGLAAIMGYGFYKVTYY